MKKAIGITLAIIIATSILAGCGQRTEEKRAEKVQTSEPETAPERDVQENITEDDDQEVSESMADYGSEGTARELIHGDGWRQCETVDDFGENGVKAQDIDFMVSDGRGYNNGVYWPMRNILYDLGQETGLDLLSEYWIVERVTPIGGEYYNVLLSQKVSGRRVSLLWAQDSNEYKVVYVVCNEGDKETYNGVRYLSQADWMPYQPGWIPYQDESSDISIEIENPFEEIQEASVCRVLELALMSYVDTEGIGKDWEVREIYGWYSLTEYLVVSDDEILWICKDSYDDEKFAVEAFRYTDFNDEETGHASEEPEQNSLEYSDDETVPEVYREVLKQYREMIQANITDINSDSVQEKLYGEWKYVWVELYAVGALDRICYSLIDLTGDGFPEMVMGTKDQFMIPYVVYYYSENEGIDMILPRTTWYKLALYEEGILELSRGDFVRVYTQYQKDAERWITVEIGTEYDNKSREPVGYYKVEYNGESEPEHEIISEGEFFDIVEKYTAHPMQLEWVDLGG